ncbi:MAG: C40 family peptidase [Lutibacter sp.]|uniref:C40 family peptidase n=1 Tax=Lutibacter sp. TaxID=1925666 RepID=UPI00385BBC73
MRIIKYVLVIILFYSCTIDKSSIELFQRLNDSIQFKYAPDKRVAIYDISFKSEENILVLEGETDNAVALEELKENLADNNINFEDRVVVLPDSSVGEFVYALANNSVSNLRSKGKHSAELVTQVILGTELKVLKKHGSFTLVQTPEKYIAWVDNGGITFLNENKFKNWKDSERLIYIKNIGNSYQDEGFSMVLTDMVLGGKVKIIEELESSFKVEFPDGRNGFVKKEEAERYSKWLIHLKPSKELIESYAKSLLGSPYLWGGTSTKGMDCSGFVKTVYLMNGFVTPRDASQQILAGKIVDENLKLEGLKKGDLMFFGSKATKDKKQRVTHVGIWLGNDRQEFIHSSKRVRINSMNSELDIFDTWCSENYLGSRRYLDVEDKEFLKL